MHCFTTRLSRYLLPLCMAFLFTACMSNTPKTTQQPLVGPQHNTVALSSKQRNAIQAAKSVKFELAIQLPHKKQLRFDTIDKHYNPSNEDISLASLIAPKQSTFSLFAMQSKNGTALASNILIGNLYDFLQRLQQSTTLEFNESLNIPTANSAFTLGVLRDTQHTLLLFNSLDTIDANSGAYNGVYRVRLKDFNAQATKLIAQYNALQTAVKTHLTALIESPATTQTLKGLQFGLRTSQLLTYKKDAQNLVLFIKNTSNKPLLLANTITTEGRKSKPVKALINITPKMPEGLTDIRAIDIKNLDEKALIIELAPTEERLLPITINQHYLNNLRLELSATNHFYNFAVSNRSWADFLQKVQKTKLQDLWLGIMAFNIPLLTVDDNTSGSSHKEIARDLLEKIQVIT